MARFITDVTIPDGAVMQPGQTFTKTWRLRNVGTCTWTGGYQLIFDQGEIMSGPVSQPFAGDVPPGHEVDLSVALKAPDNPGTYRGYWRIRNAAGVLMPILNGHQGVSFFVEIRVVLPTATPTATLTPTETALPSETPAP
ncbi:MAG: NBR1-Ig-like domain-containing protein [Anaerolineales bacterium]